MDEVGLKAIEKKWILSTGLYHVKKRYISKKIIELSIAEENFYLWESSSQELDTSSFRELEKYFLLQGYPHPLQLDKSEFITATGLIDIAFSFDKGCFLGQETVAKVQHNRGAAYKNVILESSAPFEKGVINDKAKKIAEVLETFESKKNYYALASLKRDYRVDGKSFFL